MNKTELIDLIADDKPGPESLLIHNEEQSLVGDLLGVLDERMKAVSERREELRQKQREAFAQAPADTDALVDPFAARKRSCTQPVLEIDGCEAGGHRGQRIAVGRRSDAQCTLHLGFGRCNLGVLVCPGKQLIKRDRL